MCRRCEELHGGGQEASPVDYAENAPMMGLDSIRGAQTTKPVFAGELEFDAEHVFSYHAPHPYQIPKYEQIRASAKAFAMVIEANTPRGADQKEALRRLREVVWTANSAIALDGRISR